MNHSELIDRRIRSLQRRILRQKAELIKLRSRLRLLHPPPDPEWERCDSCGQLYPDIYWADDEQWEKVVGDEFGGLRCPECFKREAWELGLEPILRFLRPPLDYKDNDLSPEVRRKVLKDLVYEDPENTPDPVNLDNLAVVDKEFLRELLAFRREEDSEQ